nr:MAG TPA: hypothetical protein [Caudoviricetes sp.]
MRGQGTTGFLRPVTVHEGDEVLGEAPKLAHIRYDLHSYLSAVNLRGFILRLVDCWATI